MGGERKIQNLACSYKGIVLHVINGVYVLLGAIMIGTAAAAYVVFKENTMFHLDILIGVIVLGVLLVLEAVFGILATILEEQWLLFIYMVLLGTQGFIQFCVSLAALAMSDRDRRELAVCGWNDLSDKERVAIQLKLGCCQFDHRNATTPLHQKESLINWGSYGCGKPRVTWAPGVGNRSSCANYPGMDAEWGGCYSEFEQEIGIAVVDGGAACLVFAFTAIVGIVAAMWFRSALRKLRYGTVLGEELL